MMTFNFSLKIYFSVICSNSYPNLKLVPTCTWNYFHNNFKMEKDPWRDTDDFTMVAN